jgi:hypothetical protein
MIYQLNLWLAQLLISIRTGGNLQRRNRAKSARIQLLWYPTIRSEIEPGQMWVRMKTRDVVGIFHGVVNYFLIGRVRKGNVGAGNRALFYTGCGCRYTGEPEWIECRQTPFVESPESELDRLCGSARMFALPRREEPRHCVRGRFRAIRPGTVLVAGTN